MYPPKRKVTKSPSVPKLPPKLPPLNAGGGQKPKGNVAPSHRAPAVPLNPPPAMPLDSVVPAQNDFVYQPEAVTESNDVVVEPSVVGSPQNSRTSSKRQHKSFTSNIEFGEGIPSSEMFTTEYRKTMAVSRNSRPVPAPKVSNRTYQTTIQLGEPSSDLDAPQMTSVYRGDFSLGRSPSGARLLHSPSGKSLPASPSPQPLRSPVTLEPVQRPGATQVLCFCCSNSFAPANLQRHINNCLADRQSVYRAIPASLRPALPKAPSRVIPGPNATAKELAEYNQEALAIYEQAAAHCPQCKQYMPPSVFPEHLRNCTAPSVVPASPVKAVKA